MGLLTPLKNAPKSYLKIKFVCILDPLFSICGNNPVAVSHENVTHKTGMQDPADMQDPANMLLLVSITYTLFCVCIFNFTIFVPS